MAKAYWVVHLDVTDPEAYKVYGAAVGKVLAAHGARFLVRGGQVMAKEGALRSRHVVVEFADYATAVACYDSPEYQAALALRQPASTADLVIVEGFDGPQPG